MFEERVIAIFVFECLQMVMVAVTTTCVCMGRAYSS